MTLGDILAQAVLALVLAAFAVVMLTRALGAFRLSREADDAADKAARDLTDADRIWREDTAFNAINSGALPPRTGPGAGSPRFTRSGNVLNSNFHAAIPNQKGQRDNV